MINYSFFIIKLTTLQVRKRKENARRNQERNQRKMMRSQTVMTKLRMTWLRMSRLTAVVVTTLRRSLKRRMMMALPVLVNQGKILFLCIYYWFKQPQSVPFLRQGLIRDKAFYRFTEYLLPFSAFNIFQSFTWNKRSWTGNPSQRGLMRKRRKSRRMAKMRKTVSRFWLLITQNCGFFVALTVDFQEVHPKYERITKIKLKT